MAEVRKKVLDDKYNTSKIKVKETKNKEKQEVKKSENQKNTKKKTNEKKKNVFERFLIFCNGVKNEFLKVHWTSKSDMIKYSIASICFIIFCSLFFYLIDILFALLQSLFV